ncbi:hypothetical protein R1flu_019372 [Riccia fluitans]|uniref:Uncharacterized protein n=1 Tax=Riccia fluitans TaxID=41844 RepID=A0ABD1ZMB2_9MARC
MSYAADFFQPSAPPIAFRIVPSTRAFLFFLQKTTGKTEILSRTLLLLPPCRGWDPPPKLHLPPPRGILFSVVAAGVYISLISLIRSWMEAAADKQRESKDPLEHSFTLPALFCLPCLACLSGFLPQENLMDRLRNALNAPLQPHLTVVPRKAIPSGNDRTLGVVWSNKDPDDPFFFANDVRCPQCFGMAVDFRRFPTWQVVVVDPSRASVTSDFRYSTLFSEGYRALLIAPKVLLMVRGPFNCRSQIINTPHGKRPKALRSRIPFKFHF